MLRVECESCKAPYQVDERRIPVTGLKMRCPKCGHTFVVKAGSGEPVPPPDPHARSTPGGQAPPAPAARKMQATMLGVGSGISKPPPSFLAKGPKDEALTPSESEVGLPAAKPAVAARPPVHATPVPGTPASPVASRGPVPRSPASAFKGTIVSAVPAPPRTVVEGDLPAIRSEAGLPVARPSPTSPKGAPPPVPRPGLPAASAAKAQPVAEPDAFGEIDLPTTTKAKVVPASDVGLPVAAGNEKKGAPGLPAVPRAIQTPRPMPAVSTDAFGEIDLPAVGGASNLPAIAASNLPATPAGKPPAPPFGKPAAPPFGKPAAPPLGKAPAGAPDNLPAVAMNNLPVPAGNLPAISAGLPAVAAGLPTPSAGLPVVAAGLPTPANMLPATADVLPVAANVLPVAANVLPTPANVMPATAPAKSTPWAGIAAIGPDPFAPLAPPAISAPPKKISAPAEHISAAPEPISIPPDFADFGELDLPPPPPPPLPQRAADRMEAPPLMMQDAAALGFDDLPPPPPLEAMSLPPAAHEYSAPSSPNDDAGLSFGEVHLAVDESGGPPIDAEAPLDVVPGPMPEPKGAVEETIGQVAPRKQRAPQTKASKRGGKIVLALVAVTILGGAALEVTPYGAFGRLAITDVIRGADYQRRASEVAGAARRKMGSDLFPDARTAAEQAAGARAEMPRARALTAYAALVEYETQLRFGPASDRIPRVRQWLAELAVQGGDPKVLPVTLAAQEALSGDPKKARTALDAASKRDVGDPLQEDIAMVRGELELAQKDATAALVAFTKAGALSKTARSEFGRARALVMGRDVDGARKALEETLKLTPKHVGARIERATLAWDAKDETAALADSAAVLEGPAKEAASETAKAQAHALRGWIDVGRGRAADARASFDAALKLDSRNVSALVGQGEVLFSEGRFTEALTRFDTAVQTDGNSVRAIVSDAKAKLALERLQDAKTQLAAERAKVPKDWRVAFWLGKAELALGNKPAAEKELLASLELLDIKDSEAFQPYVALATVYAGQGKTKEAEAKLAEAKAKLPDTSSLRRALGEVAASRGDFDGAVQNFRTAIEKDPLDLSTRFRLGVTLRRMRKVNDATAEFDKIVAVDKDYPGLALERGLLYEESGDIDKALEQFQSALARAPDDADLKLRVGAAFVAIGRPNDALPMLRSVYEKRSQSAEANHFLGRALFLQSGGASQVEAMRFLKRASELDPNRAEYHLYVGWAANNAVPVQFGLARDSIEKALAIDKLLADAYWQRGVIERKQSAVDDAIVDLKRALELKPTRIDAHAALAECYSDKNDLNAAMGEWQKALAGEAKPEWHFRYGKLLFLRANFAEATKHLVVAADEGEKMERKPGWLHEAEFLSGEVLRKAGKKAEAIDRYRRFLEIAPINSPDRKDANTALSELGASPRPR